MASASVTWDFFAALFHIYFIVLLALFCFFFLSQFSIIIENHSSLEKYIELVSADKDFNNLLRQLSFKVGVTLCRNY